MIFFSKYKENIEDICKKNLVSSIKSYWITNRRNLFGRIFGLKNSVKLIHSVSKPYMIKKNPKIIEKNTAEFNYELLHNILLNYLYLNKWINKIEKKPVLSVKKKK